MRIVHLYKDYFPPTVGGMEQHIGMVSTLQAQAGAEVTVLTSHPGVRRTVRETVGGVRVIRCAEHGRVWSTPFCPDMPLELKRLEADLFHLHFPSPPGEVSCVAMRPRGAMVVTWHSDIVRQRAVLPIYGHVVHSLLRRVEHVMPTYERMIPNSPFLRHYAAKCRTVPLGIDLSSFVATSESERAGAEIRARLGTPIVLFVGRMMAYKGVDHLLRAMRDVEARLVVVGTGPDLPRVRQIAADLGLGERVHFAGRVEPERVRDYVAAADVGVLPSVQEAFGLSMVEMMAHGRPVVCTELGTGTTEINRHEETGLVVPPADPAALAAALRRLLGDDSLRRRLGEGARRRAGEQYSAEAMMRGIGAVYASALARRASHPRPGRTGRKPPRIPGEAGGASG